MTPAEFVRAEQDEIIATWGERSTGLAHARTLPGLVLLNHLPAFLEALAKRMDGTSEPLVLEAAVLEHAINRSRHGVPLHEVVSEYAILREVIAEEYGERGADELPEAFGQAFEDAVSETLELYRRAGIERDRRRSLLDGE